MGTITSVIFAVKSLIVIMSDTFMTCYVETVILLKELRKHTKNIIVNVQIVKRTSHDRTSNNQK